MPNIPIKDNHCKICNKKFEFLGRHIKIHKISIKEYCSKFNIPYIEYIRDYTCKICNSRITYGKGGLSRHLRYNHNQMPLSRYYDSFYLKNELEKFCKTCGKETKLIDIKNGYRHYCSRNCAAKNSAVQKLKVT